MQEQIDDLKKQVTELQDVINSMRYSSTIPFDIGAAFEDRIGSGVTIQNPTGTTFSKSVNEAGSATYSVANIMDGTLPVTVAGTVVYVPFYI